MAALAKQRGVSDEARAMPFKEADRIAARHSVARPGEIHWLQIAWEGDFPHVKVVQWAGYAYGVRVGVVTKIRGFPGQPGGYMVTMRRRGLGVFRHENEAKEEVGDQLAALLEPIVELFAAMGAFMARCEAERQRLAPIMGEVGRGIWALGCWAQAAWEEKLAFDRDMAAMFAAESREVIRGCRAQIDAFNARYSVKHRQTA